MEKYANKNNIVKNEVFNLFKDNILCPICQELLLEQYVCLNCLNSICKKCKDEKGRCPKNCESPEFKEANEKLQIIKKFKFMCIKGCGEELSFDEIEKHYNSECLPKNKLIKILTPKEAADYTEKTGEELPIITSMSKI